MSGLPVLWWVGPLSAIAGVAIGSGVPLMAAARRRRLERRGEVIAMISESLQARSRIASLTLQNIQAPLYRLPTTIFKQALPKLIGDGHLQSTEIDVLVELLNRIDELNRGLDRAGDAHSLKVISLPPPGTTDIATFRVDEQMLRDMGKPFTPLSSWPPRTPQEGRGIMLAGYPGAERIEESFSVNFGLFTAIVIARTVSDRQITWLIDPEEQVQGAAVPPLPPRYGLGGISGGPLITWMESENYVASYALGGIISEHPDYAENDFSIERVVACRADLITTTGRVIE